LPSPGRNPLLAIVVVWRCIDNKICIFNVTLADQVCVTTERQHATNTKGSLTGDVTANHTHGRQPPHLLPARASRIYLEGSNEGVRRIVAIIRLN
jgi:hypothetical protein